MKQKIKLRDLTLEQYKKWKDDFCLTHNILCENCPFHNSLCLTHENSCWINHKDLYSDKFLDQEVEIEIPDLLTKEEKEYLETVLRPFKDRVKSVRKGETWTDELLRIKINDLKNKGFENIDFPVFKKGSMYKCLESDKEYTLEDLGLFTEESSNKVIFTIEEPKKYKITLTRFFKLKKGTVAIRCNTEEKAKKLFIAFNKLGKKWRSGEKYTISRTLWYVDKENTCYFNDNSVNSINPFADKIYEFEDVDLNN